MLFLAMDRPPRAPPLLIGNPSLRELGINISCGDQTWTYGTVVEEKPEEWVKNVLWDRD